MPSHFYAPTKQDRFAFGIWCLQNRGRDPFGDQTRPELPALECIRGLAQRNCYGFEFHDNDLIPFDASASQRCAPWSAATGSSATRGLSQPVSRCRSGCR